jgi:hypothetical protein
MARHLLADQPQAEAQEQHQLADLQVEALEQHQLADLQVQNN